MKANREVVKAMIELAPNVNEADKVINDFSSISEKIAFLKGMFGLETIGHGNDNSDEMTYFAMLNTIINN